MHYALCILHCKGRRGARATSRAASEASGSRRRTTCRRHGVRRRLVPEASKGCEPAPRADEQPNASAGQPPGGGTCLSRLAVGTANGINRTTGAPTGGSARRYGKSPATPKKSSQFAKLYKSKTRSVFRNYALCIMHSTFYILQRFFLSITVTYLYTDEKDE